MKNQASPVALDPVAATPSGLPSVEQIAAVLIAHPWPSPFFKDICPTCLAEVKAGPNSPDHAAHQARAVLALFEAAVPSIGANALREAAATIREQERQAHVASLGISDPAWSRLSGMSFAHGNDARSLEMLADRLAPLAVPTDGATETGEPA